MFHYKRLFWECQSFQMEGFSPLGTTATGRGYYLNVDITHPCEGVKHLKWISC